MNSRCIENQARIAGKGSQVIAADLKLAEEEQGKANTGVSFSTPLIPMEQFSMLSWRCFASASAGAVRCIVLEHGTLPAVFLHVHCSQGLMSLKT